MKAIRHLFLAILVFMPLLALAGVPKITTLTGKTYRDCEIVTVHPDGVSFTHAKGAAKVLFTDLPQSMRSQLGYNPKKAAAYERELAEKRRREAELRAARQAELSRANLIAQEMELSRLRFAEQQAQAANRALAAQPFYQSAAFPLLPPLGAVFDSRDYRYGRGSHSGWYVHPGWTGRTGYSHASPNRVCYFSGSPALNFPVRPGVCLPAPVARPTRGSTTFVVRP